MFTFPTKTLSTIKRILLRQNREVEKNLKEVDEDDPLRTPALAESSEPGTDSSLADTHNKTLVLKNNLINLSNSIKKALIKIKSGSYGKCEKCGQKIEVRRLLAMPIANLCLSCSKKATKP